MQLSLITVILSLTVGALAQVALQDPVYMDKRGNIVPANPGKRSEYERRQIAENIPVKTDPSGNVVLYDSGEKVKRNRFPAPIVHRSSPGTGLHEPVRMDARGNIVKA